MYYHPTPQMMQKENLPQTSTNCQEDQWIYKAPCPTSALCFPGGAPAGMTTQGVDLTGAEK